jgi:SAM-dependent methyltransferase
MSGTFDPSVAHSARVYNYWLGGKDNHAPDREAAEEVMRRRPEVVTGAQANRYFLARAVRYLAATRGVRQLIDIGCGLPAPDNTHEVAQRAAPGCRVVYVDNDPLVLANARALLTPGPRDSCSCAYVDADLHGPHTILEAAAKTLDFARPVGVLLLAILHFIPDADDPAGIVHTLASALAPGSFVAISHLTADFAPGPVAAGTAAYIAAVPVPLVPRSHAQVSALFGGLSLVAPAVVPVSGWRPDFPDALAERADLYAGLAEKLPRRGAGVRAP